MWHNTLFDLSDGVATTKLSTINATRTGPSVDVFAGLADDGFVK